MKVEIGPADAVQGQGYNHGPVVEISGADHVQGGNPRVPGYLEDVFDGARWRQVFRPEKPVSDADLDDWEIATAAVRQQ